MVSGLVALGMAVILTRTTRSALAAGTYYAQVRGYSGASANYDMSASSSSGGGTTGGGYIGSHDTGHAQLNSLDEYVESGLGSGLRIAGSGLMTSGALLTAAGIIGSLGIFSCNAWPAATGLSLLGGLAASGMQSIRKRLRPTQQSRAGEHLTSSVPDLDSDQSGMAEEKVEIKEERTDEA